MLNKYSVIKKMLQTQKEGTFQTLQELLGRLIGPPTAARFTRAFFCTFVTAVLLYAKHLGDILELLPIPPYTMFSTSLCPVSPPRPAVLRNRPAAFTFMLVENSTFLQWPRPRHISDQSCNSWRKPVEKKALPGEQAVGTPKLAKKWKS